MNFRIWSLSKEKSMATRNRLSHFSIFLATMLSLIRKQKLGQLDMTPLGGEK